MMSRQWSSERHIELSRIEQAVGVFQMLFALLARTIRLKRISILVVQLEGKGEKRLAVIAFSRRLYRSRSRSHPPARRSMITLG